MMRRGLRASSIDKRMSAVRRWIDHAGDAWRSSDRELLEEWLDDRQLAARSRYGEISHLHQFYTWARREQLVDADPTELVERPRLPRRLPRPARMGDVDQAIAGADASMRIALSLMVDAGLRCCEVAGLQWTDVDLAARVLYVTGKGGHDRVVGIPTRLVDLLLSSDGVAGAVFGRTVSAGRVSQLVNAHLRRCGVAATAHQLRHLYATRLLEATGGNLAAVQQALGHASVVSTQIYAQVDPRRAIDAARQLAA